MLPVIAAALQVVVCAAAELGAGLEATARAGVAPIAPTEPSDPAAAFELIPESIFRWYARRRSLSLRYAPRLFARYPNLVGTTRPLLYHQGFMDYGEILSRRARFGTQLYGGAGEVDYSSQAVIFRDSPTTPSQSAIIEMATASGTSGFTVQATRRVQLTVGALGGYSGPLSDETDIAKTAYLGGFVGDELRLTRRDTLAATVTGSKAWAIGTARYWIGEVSGSWTRRLAPDATLQLGVGVSGAKRIASDAELQLHPTGVASVAAVLARAPRSVLSGRLTMEASADLDRVLGEYIPMVSSTAALEWLRRPDWTGGLELSASTTTTATPRAETETPTFVAARAFVREGLSRSVTIEYGAQAQARASHLAAHHFESLDHELWGYVQLRWSLRTRAEAAPP